MPNISAIMSEDDRVSKFTTLQAIREIQVKQQKMARDLSNIAASGGAISITAASIGGMTVYFQMTEPAPNPMAPAIWMRDRGAGAPVWVYFNERKTDDSWDFIKRWEAP